MEQIGELDQTSRTRFRLLVGAAAAAVVVVAAAVLVITRTGDDNDAVTTPADDTTTTSTTAPADETTTTTTSAPDQDGSGSGSPGTTGGASPTLGSVRDVDFANLTYPAPCPSLLDTGDLALVDGRGSLDGPEAEGLQFAVELRPVVYGDVTGDGVDDALVLIFCHHQRAEQAAAWAGVYGLDAAGTTRLIGEPLVIDANVSEVSAPRDGQVTALVYQNDDLSGPLLERTWDFDGEAFELIASDPQTP